MPARPAKPTRPARSARRKTLWARASSTHAQKSTMYRWVQYRREDIRTRERLHSLFCLGTRSILLSFSSFFARRVFFSYVPKNTYRMFYWRKTRRAEWVPIRGFKKSAAPRERFALVSSERDTARTGFVHWDIRLCSKVFRFCIERLRAMHCKKVFITETPCDACKYTKCTTSVQESFSSHSKVFLLAVMRKAQNQDRILHDKRAE